MSDFDFFAASITRTSLGLNPLDLSDQINYKLGNELLGGTQSWQRQSVRSPYVDGEFTVNRTRARVDEKFSVQVMGADQLMLQDNLAQVIDAFSQHRFVLTVEMDGAVYSYDCEASDYTIDWTGPRWMAKTVLVTFMVPRQPRLLTGGL